MLIPEKLKISRMNRRTLNWLLQSELLKQSTQKKLAWSSIKFRKYMRFTQDEKYEIIQLVEDSELGVNRTLVELDISKRTFYNWYGKYTKHGYDGLSPKRRTNNSQWNRIPHQVRNEVVEIALEVPELSPRELAYRMIDQNGYFISESSVYRILKSRGLITSPAYIVMSSRIKQPECIKCGKLILQTLK